MALVASAYLVAAGAASADTSFGADPNQAPNTALTCATGAPTGFEFPPIFFGTQGAQSCMWTWSNPSVGSDIVPIPVTGGSGTITGVTLPAMTAPGPMAVVVMTAALNSTGDPGHPQSICCQIKQVGPTFTVPAGQVTTVPQSLHVSATEEANLSQNGDTSFGDLLGIAVLSPSASLPILYTGNTSLSNFDGTYAYYPAPAGANGEYTTPLDPVGFQLLARFTLALDGAPPTPAPLPAPAPTPIRGPAAKDGVKLGGNAFRLGADGNTLNLGKATNPPTATTTQTLIVPAGAASHGGRLTSAVIKTKTPVVLGKGKTTVPSGKSAAIKLILNSKGRAQLAKGHPLKAGLKIVATNPQGESQTILREVTVKPAKPKKHR
jgi:hypothetical protein